MDMSTSPRRELVDRRPARIEDILQKYPDVTADEAAEILHFLKQGHRREVRLITRNEQLRPQLFRFRSDHASAFPFVLRDYLIIVTVVLALAATCLLLWDAGAGR